MNDRLLQLAIGAVLLLGLATTSWGAKAEKEQGIQGSLKIPPAVGILGAAPSEPIQAGEGDVLLLQIRYPVVPPMPIGAKLGAGAEGLQLLGVTRGSSAAAILTREPQSGGLLGVGFVQVLVRVRTAGKHAFEVEVKLGDDTVKKVPFVIEAPK